MEVPSRSEVTSSSGLVARVVIQEWVSWLRKNGHRMSLVLQE